VRARLAALALGAATLSLALAGGAAAKTTKDFTFTSKGTAVGHSATQGSDDPTTYEDFPFTIGSDEENGTINVHIDWGNPADDWDLYVYRKGAGNKLQTIGQSAGGAPGNEENAVADSQGLPWKAGGYVVRVVNYAAALPDFKGTAKFGAFIPYNAIPIARLSAPKRVKKGKTVTLDASASHDPDGTIKSYAFDLDGNGSMEVSNGSQPVLKRVLSPGVHHVAVRVIDDKGLRAFANRTVVVGKKKHKKHK
jgi:PKD domain-containing protein